MKTIHKLDGSSQVPNVLSNAMSNSFPFQGVEPIDPETIASLFSYFNASDISTLFQDSGKVTPVASDGDPVGAWCDIKGGHDSTQGTASRKPTYKEFGGTSWLDFDGGDILTVPVSTATFNFLHDGSGGEVIVIGQIDDGWTTSSPFVSNNDAYSAKTGVNIFGLYSAGYAFACNASKSAGGTTLTNYWKDTQGDFTTGSPHVLQWSYVEGAVTEVVMEYDEANAKDTQVSPDSAPSAGNATHNLAIGARNTLTSLLLNGRIYSIAIFDDRLTNEERLGVAQFLKNEAGI